MTGDRFEEAAAFAADSAYGFRRLPPEKIVHADSPREYIMWHSLGFEWRETTAGNYFRAPEGVIDILALDARTDLDARSLLKHHVERKLLALVPLSAAESRAACAFVQGSWPKLPVRPGTKRSSNFERDFHILALTKWIVQEFGLSPTRNDAAIDRRSACDAVSVAFKAEGVNEVTFETVKKIFYRRDLAELSKEYCEIRNARRCRSRVQPGAV